MLSTGLTAAAQGKDIYAAVNNELGALATEDIKNYVKDAVLNFIDPVEELPMDTGEMLTDAVLPDKETLDKFKEPPVQGDPLTEAQDLYEKIDAPPTSKPLAPTFAPPDAPTEKTTVGGVPKLTPEAPIDIPCLLYTSPSPRDGLLSRMPSSA